MILRCAGNKAAKPSRSLKKIPETSLCIKYYQGLFAYLSLDDLKCAAGWPAMATPLACKCAEDRVASGRVATERVVLPRNAAVACNTHFYSMDTLQDRVLPLAYGVAGDAYASCRCSPVRQSRFHCHALHHGMFDCTDWDGVDCQVAASDWSRAPASRCKLLEHPSSTKQK